MLSIILDGVHIIIRDLWFSHLPHVIARMIRK
jgi:hypothetical protein